MFATLVYACPLSVAWRCLTTRPLISFAIFRNCTVVITRSTMPLPPKTPSLSAHALNCSKITATNRFASRKMAITTNEKA